MSSHLYGCGMMLHSSKLRRRSQITRKFCCVAKLWSSFLRVGVLYCAVFGGLLQVRNYKFLHGNLGSSTASVDDGRTRCQDLQSHRTRIRGYNSKPKLDKRNSPLKCHQYCLLCRFSARKD